MLPEHVLRRSWRFFLYGSRRAARATNGNGQMFLHQVAALGVSCARGWQRVEWLVLAASAPLLLFPGRFVWLGAALIGTTWLARRLGSGRWTVRTAADRFVLLLSLALIVSLMPSIRLDYSMPKFWGVILGLATFYAVLNTCREDGALRLAAWALIAAGAGLALVGLVGMAVPPNKIIEDRGVYSGLPRLISSVQSSTVVTQGIHPNELAGVLILLLPLACFRVLRGDPLRWLAAAAAVLMVAALVLTQSRAALLGLVVAGCVGATVIAGRRGLITAVVLLAVGAQALIQVEGPDNLRQQLLGDSPTAGVESLSGRVELWQRGLAMAVDMPLTGIGLNTFPAVLQTYYPTILHSPQGDPVPHVHNLYLQTLLDFGLLGLVGWLAIVATAIAAGLCAARASVHTPMVAGLLVGLLAHGVYSLVDAVTLGAKPAVLVWVILGLLLVIGAQANGSWQSRTRSSVALRSSGVLLALTILLAPALVAAATLNAARLVLHHGAGTTNPLLDAELHIAQTISFAPLTARAYAAEALLSRQRGETLSELDSLDRAIAVGGSWDPSLSLRLGDLQAAYGDRPRAIAAWRAADALPTLLDRASASPPNQALDWYTAAQSVDPTSWRPYAGAARILQSNDPNRAAILLSQALHLRSDDPARTSLARRLIDPNAPLATTASINPSPDDSEMLLSSSRLLQSRDDMPGALFAAQLSTQANPGWSGTWQHYADILDRVGRTTQAAEARSRAQRLTR
jgi:tetratricopeptide (TPR) repeat protein